ncbi:MAG: response regulator transcription factor, partial [Verrucomicrobiia bacterium]
MGDADNKKVQVLIADNHPFLRLGIKSMIDATPDMKCCGEAEDFAQTLAGVEKLQPDVLVMDLCLGDRDGLEQIKS